MLFKLIHDEHVFLLQVALSKPQRNFHESSSIRSKGNIKLTGIPLELSKMSNNVLKNRFSKYEHDPSSSRAIQPPVIQP